MLNICGKNKHIKQKQNIKKKRNHVTHVIYSVNILNMILDSYQSRKISRAQEKFGMWYKLDAHKRNERTNKNIKMHLSH